MIVSLFCTSLFEDLLTCNIQVFVVILLRVNEAAISVLVKPVNLFPVTSPTMVIAITKHEKSSETKRENWEDTLSLSF